MGGDGRKCLDCMVSKHDKNKPVGLYPCHGQGGNQVNTKLFLCRFATKEILPSVWMEWPRKASKSLSAFILVTDKGGIRCDRALKMPYREIDRFIGDFPKTILLFADII